MLTLVNFVASALGNGNNFFAFMPKFSQRLSNYRATQELSRDEMGNKLGVSGKYVGMLERGEKDVEDDSTISQLLAIYEGGTTSTVGEESAKYGVEAIAVRWVPVVSWTHAGQAAEYEELPAHWQDEQVPTFSKDAKSFGLIIDGDSMEPRCMAGDRVVVMPSEDPRDGCLVVAKLKRDGVILRRFSRLSGGRVRLIAYNPLYPSTDYAASEFHWIYPVESTIRKEWT